jgi:hypothetical protein
MGKSQRELLWPHKLSEGREICERYRFVAPFHPRNVIKSANKIYVGDGMDDIPWYAEASLRAPGRVYCAGSLAQCIRKWQRLPEIDQSSAYINLAKEFGGRVTLDREYVVALAAHDDLRRI